MTFLTETAAASWMDSVSRTAECVRLGAAVVAGCDGELVQRCAPSAAAVSKAVAQVSASASGGADIVAAGEACSGTGAGVPVSSAEADSVGQLQRHKAEIKLPPSALGMLLAHKGEGTRRVEVQTMATLQLDKSAGVFCASGSRESVVEAVQLLQAHWCAASSGVASVCANCGTCDCSH